MSQLGDIKRYKDIKSLYRDIKSQSQECQFQDIKLQLYFYFLYSEVYMASVENR